MTQHMSRMQRLLVAYLLWELSKPRVIRKVVRHMHAPAQAFSAGDLAGASIADLGTKDHDLLDGLTDDDHTQYLLVNGTRAMTGNLTIGAYKLVTTNCMLYETDSLTLSIVNLADTAYRSLKVYTLYAVEFQGTDTNSIIASRGVNGADFSFVNRHASAWWTVAKMDDDWFEIPRGGNIILLAGKSVDAYTNAGYMKPRRLSQSEQPTPQTGETLIWRDTDDDKTYLVYEDPDLGTRKSELT